MKIFIPRLFVLIAIFIFFISSPSKGASFTITAGNFQFSPDTLININIGDTIEWIWQDGLHTTTSNGIPAGAMPWNELLDSMNTTFTYVITVPGIYHYISVPDLPTMQGQFTVNSLIGITAPTNSQFDFSVLSNLVSNQISLRFSLSEPLPVELMMSDIYGKWSKILMHETMTPGYHDRTFYLPQNISSGMYLITMRYKNMLVTKRIVIMK
ncbi:MAG: hypothetical protein H0V61_08825 [Chitinophagales bacterium]|jgi:plastocyanin|nr:hypothetical protein [Chitinophagales bacterium]